MKHIFKNGDAVKCSSRKELIELALLAEKYQYRVQCDAKTNKFPENTILRFNYDSKEFHGCDSLSFYPINFIPKEEFIKLLTQDKKIIGYRSPIDLFRGNWKAGTIFVKDNGKDLTMFYKPKDCTNNSVWSMPEDIVETWEPVFEENQSITIKVGSKNKEITIFKDGKIQIESETTTIQMVKALYSDFSNDFSATERIIGTNWKISIDKNARFIRIGCIEHNNLFSLTDLTYIIDIYDKLK